MLSKLLAVWDSAPVQGNLRVKVPQKTLKIWQCLVTATAFAKCRVMQKDKDTLKTGKYSDFWREKKRKNTTCSKWTFNFDISITCWPCQGQNKHGETWLRHWICTVVLNGGLKEKILPVFSNPEHSVVKYMYDWQCSLQIKYSELWNQTDPVFWP